MKKLFGTDGIRGVANEYPMTAEMALRVGRVVVAYFAEAGNDARIVIGKDTRLSGRHAGIRNCCRHMRCRRQCVSHRRAANPRSRLC